ncbi:MAG: hypothetical protein KJ548_09650 [Actinobacteria bacterium]|nr:hypothetical protein [Actinomycetota bacterium]MBU4336826.1 hypothetical protein [Actinomycetota bacterium]
MQDQRRRTVIVVLAVFDALALLTIAFLVLRGFEAGRTVAVPPSATGSASSTPTATDAPVTFALPSGNISCTLAADGATCTIGDIAFTATPAAGCTGSAGHVVLLDRTGVTTPCTTGTATVAADALVMAYGTSRTVGDYTCASATTGVTCTRGDGAGFRLSRTALTVLP